MEVWQWHGFRESLESKDFPRGEEAWLVVVVGKEALEVVNEVFMSGAVTPGQGWSGLCGGDVGVGAVSLGNVGMRVYSKANGRGGVD